MQNETHVHIRFHSVILQHRMEYPCFLTVLATGGEDKHVKKEIKSSLLGGILVVCAILNLSNAKQQLVSDHGLDEHETC